MIEDKPRGVADRAWPEAWRSCKAFARTEGDELTPERLGLGDEDVFRPTALRVHMTAEPCAFSLREGFLECRLGRSLLRFVDAPVVLVRRRMPRTMVRRRRRRARGRMRVKRLVPRSVQKPIERVPRPQVRDMYEMQFMRRASHFEHVLDELTSSLDADCTENVHGSVLFSSWRTHQRSQMSALPATSIAGTNTIPSLKYWNDETSRPLRRKMRTHKIVASEPTVVRFGPRSQPSTAA